jgi:hypothetical protein
VLRDGAAEHSAAVFDIVAGKRYFRRWLEKSLSAMERVAREQAVRAP